MRPSLLSSSNRALLAHAASPVEKPTSGFALETSADDPHELRLISAINGSRPLWKRRFVNHADIAPVVARFASGALDLAFYGRVTSIFGPAAITAAVDEILDALNKEQRERMEAEAQRQRDYYIIELVVHDGARWHELKLKRRSDTEAGWSVHYDRAVERDRLSDWLRWQKPRYSEYLDRAATDGLEAVTRDFVNEMFETERRIKAAGRGAGGTRPLRMWRGDW